MRAKSGKGSNKDVFLRKYGFHPNTGFVHFASLFALPLFALLFLIEKSECADFGFDFACLAREIPCKSKNLKSRDEARKMKIPILIKKSYATTYSLMP